MSPKDGLSVFGFQRITSASPRGADLSDTLQRSEGDPQAAWALPLEAAHWSLTTPQEKLVKIGAKVVSQGRYAAFQLAEVAVSRAFFAQTLDLIADLRAPPPKPALRGASGRARSFTGKVCPGTGGLCLASRFRCGKPQDENDSRIEPDQ